MATGLNGVIGALAQCRVEVEYKTDLELVPIPRRRLVVMPCPGESDENRSCNEDLCPGK